MTLIMSRSDWGKPPPARAVRPECCDSVTIASTATSAMPAAKPPNLR